MVTKTGMIMARTNGDVVCAFATRLISASIAPVFCSTANAPPTINTKPMI